MDQLKNMVGNATGGNTANAEGGQSGGGGGFMDSINSSLGGGAQGEKNEDYLDKGVDAYQQYVGGGGDQSNENAAEQFKDEQISDAIRSQYQSTTGSEFPVADKS